MANRFSQENSMLTVSSISPITQGFLHLPFAFLFLTEKWIYTTISVLLT